MSKESRKGGEKERSTVDLYVGIDFGTSSTVAAVVAGIDGDLQMLHFPSGSALRDTLLPSQVFWNFESHQWEVGIPEGNEAIRSDPAGQLELGFTSDNELQLQGPSPGAIERVKAFLGEPPDQCPKYWEFGDGSLIAPSDVARVILERVREVLNIEYPSGQIRKLAITHPASWHHPAKVALKEAVQSAFSLDDSSFDEKVLFLPEPAAAALHYWQSKGRGRFQKPMQGLVFDWGGGTADAVVVNVNPVVEINKNPIVISKAGVSRQTWLGGKDLDLALCDLLAQNASDQDGDLAIEFEEASAAVRRFLQRHDADCDDSVEEWKLRISRTLAKHSNEFGDHPSRRVPKPPEVDVEVEIEGHGAFRYRSDGEITWAEVFDCLSPFFLEEDSEKCIQNPIRSALDKAEIQADDLDFVLLAGGGSLFPMTRWCISTMFPEAELIQSGDAMEGIAKGAALFAAGRIPFQQVIPEHILIEVARGKSREGLQIVQAGTELPFGKAASPIETKHLFSTPGGMFLEIPVLTEDPAWGMRSRRYHGKLYVKFPAHKEEGLPVKHWFWVDRNGLFHQRIAIGKEDPVDDVVAIWNEDPEFSPTPGSWEEAEDLIKRKRFSVVAQALEAHPERFGNNSLYWNSLGRCYSALGNYQKAADCHERFFEKRRSAIAYGNLVQTLGWAGMAGQLADLLYSSAEEFAHDLYAAHCSAEGFIMLDDRESAEAILSPLIEDKEAFIRMGMEDPHRARAICGIIGRELPPELELALLTCEDEGGIELESPLLRVDTSVDEDEL